MHLLVFLSVNTFVLCAFALPKFDHQEVYSPFRQKDSKIFHDSTDTGIPHVAFRNDVDKTNRKHNVPKSIIDSQSNYIQFGDMIFPRELLKDNDANQYQYASVVNGWQMWKKGRIPYVIHSSLRWFKQDIFRAMKEFHNKTCIRFVPRTNERNYVTIYYGHGCFSNIGATKRDEQFLSLGRGCHDHGTILHELGHTVGFFHEQNRSDRDKHIRVLWDNIAFGFASQFQKMYPNEHHIINGFDLESVMLYGGLAFSKNGRSKTIVHRGGKRIKEVYQKTRLSSSDVERINALYC